MWPQWFFGPETGHLVPEAREVPELPGFSPWDPEEVGSNTISGTIKINKLANESEGEQQKAQPFFPTSLHMGRYLKIDLAQIQGGSELGVPSCSGFN